jgi:hypothetical protein
MTEIDFPGFPGLDFGILKFHDFPGFPGPVRTLNKAILKRDENLFDQAESRADMNSNVFIYE